LAEALNRVLQTAHQTLRLLAFLLLNQVGLLKIKYPESCYFIGIIASHLDNNLCNVADIVAQAIAT
jgi:hypothetical protein